MIGMIGDGKGWGDWGTYGRGVEGWEGKHDCELRIMLLIVPI